MRHSQGSERKKEEGQGGDGKEEHLIVRLVDITHRDVVLEHWRHGPRGDFANHLRPVRMKMSQK